MRNRTEEEKWSGFAAGASAILFEGAWLVIEPLQPGQTPTALPRGLAGFAIVTGDNPGGDPASAAENERARTLLRERLEEFIPEAAILESVGGFPDAAEPTSWSGAERGYALRISREEAALIGREFGQLAVYTLEGSRRVLLSCAEDEGFVLEQQFQVRQAAVS